MNKPVKFALPPPNFNKNVKDACKPKTHFLTPSGMSLLPREKQPPPMYGKHGSTVPARLLPQQPCNNRLQKQIANTTVEKQYCEPCELEFHSTDDLKRHRAQHEKCPVTGCNYKGHPSVIDKHINALHTSGLFDKFKKLSTPEDIAAWREERRKRYPTLANVLLKQKAQEQRQKRGERLEESKNRFGKVNDRKRAQANDVQDKGPNEPKRSREANGTNNRNNRRNRKNKRKHNTQNQDKATEQNIKTKIDKVDNQVEQEGYTVRCGIKIFTGTSQLKDYQHFKDKKKVANSNVLFGLVGMYGSDDDESDTDENNDTKPLQPELVSEEYQTETLSDDDKSTKNNDGIGTIENEADVTKEFNNFNDVQDNVNITKENTQLSVNFIQTATNDIESGKLNQDHLSLNTSSILNKKQTGSRLAYQLNTQTESLPANVTDAISSDEAPEEVPIQKTVTEISYTLDTALHPISNIGPAVKPTTKAEEQPTASFKQRFPTKRKYGLDYRKARLRKQNTMLEKLLETDIRHERNVLLQCVRHVCENNFFGIGQNCQE